jgi:hypothetical protein
VIYVYYALAAWGCVAAISAAIDMYFVFRALSGREGEEFIAVTREHAARAGGVRKWIVVSLAQDILVPWLTFQGLLIAYRGEKI